MKYNWKRIHFASMRFRWISCDITRVWTCHHQTGFHYEASNISAPWPPLLVLHQSDPLGVVTTGASVCCSCAPRVADRVNSACVCGVVKPLSCTNSLHAHADLIQIQRHVLTAMRADSPGIVWCSCLRFENNFTLSSENDCRDKQMKSESDVLSLVSEHDSMFSVYLCVETRELGRNQFKNCSVQWRIVWLQWG